MATILIYCPNLTVVLLRDAYASAVLAVEIRFVCLSVRLSNERTVRYSRRSSYCSVVLMFTTEKDVNSVDRNHRCGFTAYTTVAARLARSRELDPTVRGYKTSPLMATLYTCYHNSACRKQPAALQYTMLPVSYTHLTLPTNREV